VTLERAYLHGGGEHYRVKNVFPPASGGLWWATSRADEALSLVAGEGVGANGPATAGEEVGTRIL
jgi:hypothetical protein